MGRKLSKSDIAKKAWQTRKRNLLSDKEITEKAVKLFSISNDKWRNANKLLDEPVIIPLCGQLDDAIMKLETRVSNAIAKINSLM